MVYVVNFIVFGLVPLALAGIGAHLAVPAGPALDNPKRRKTLLLVWGLAGFGFISAAVQQVNAYNSDKKHDTEQQKIQTKLDDTTKRLEQSARNEENVKGQLTSLAVVMSTFAKSVPKSGGISQDVVKALASALSLASIQAAKGSPTQSQPAQSAQPLSTTSALSPTNLELKRSVNLLAGRFFGFDSSTRDRLERVYRMGVAGGDKEGVRQTILSQQNKEFAPLRATALIFRTELLSRLPPQPTDDAVKAVLDDGNYAFDSATTVMNYLLKLASLLPDR